MRQRPSLLTCFSLAIALVAGSGTAIAEIYHWVDETGTPHYSDRAEEVPPAYRDQIVGLLDELERSGRLTIIEGQTGPGQADGAEDDEDTAAGLQPAQIPDFGEFPGFAADPTEMLERLKGPMIALAVVLTLVVCGFVFAFMSMALLVGCRLVGQESPGFKKAYGIVIVQFLAGLVAGPGVVAIFGQPQIADLSGALRLQALNMGVFLLVHAAVLRGMLCDSMGKSLALALVVNLVVLGLGILLGIGFVMCAGGAAILGAG